MSILKKLFRGESYQDDEVFSNTGFTDRERKVTRLLRKQISRTHPRALVNSVRFCPANTGPAGFDLGVSIDFVDYSMFAGYVKEEWNARQQAKAIYDTVIALDELRNELSKHPR